MPCRRPVLLAAGYSVNHPKVFMSAPKFNKFILRRTPTHVDMSRFRGSIDGPIYTHLTDGTEVYGRLAAIGQRAIAVCMDTGRPKIIKVRAITLTYFGPAADLQRAWRQWSNIPRAQVHFKVSEHGIDEPILPTPALDHHMAAVRRYLDGETATLDQALGLAHETRGNPIESRNRNLDEICWQVFVRRELLTPKRRWAQIEIEVPGAAITPAFRRAYARRKPAMLERALELAIRHDLTYPLKKWCPEFE